MSERFVVQNNRQLREAVKRYCRSSNHGLPPIGEWDVSQVTDMSDLFLGNRTFNDDINNWNVSNVVDFSRMFKGAEVFNQPLDKWGPKLNPGANFNEMFYGAKLFNQNLRSWDNALAGNPNTDMMFNLSGISSSKSTIPHEYYNPQDPEVTPVFNTKEDKKKYMDDYYSRNPVPNYSEDDTSGGYRKSRKAGKRRTRNHRHSRKHKRKTQKRKTQKRKSRGRM